MSRKQRPVSASLPLTKMQINRLMGRHSVPGTLSGSGLTWEVELPDDAAKAAFVKNVTKKVGGYRCGHGGWVLRAGYQADDIDFNNPASRHHY